MAGLRPSKIGLFPGRHGAWASPGLGGVRRASLALRCQRRGRWAVSRVTLLLSLLPAQHTCRERSKKKKKKQEKQMKGKVEKKGAASKSLSSTKSPAKNMSESFKSKEFVSSDESSSGESKKEVGLLVGWGGPAGPSSLGSAPLVPLEGGPLIPSL